MINENIKIKLAQAGWRSTDDVNISLEHTDGSIATKRMALRVINEVCFDNKLDVKTIEKHFNTLNDEVLWVKQYSDTDEPDKYNRWSRLAYVKPYKNELDDLKRIDLGVIGRIDDGNQVKYLVKYYFPKINKDQNNLFDTFESAKLVFLTNYRHFVYRLVNGKKQSKFQSLLERLNLSDDLKSEIKVHINLTLLGLPTDLGYRENKMWGDDEEDKLKVIGEVTDRLTNEIIESYIKLGITNED